MFSRDRNNKSKRGSWRKILLFPLAVLTALFVPVFIQTATAAQITFVSVTGQWHDPTDNLPGSQPGQPVIVNGVPTASVNWGVTNGAQSGYDFSRTIPGAQTLPPTPTPFFPLGTFTHRNFPVNDPSLTSIQLDVILVLNVNGVQTAPLPFTFSFSHVETPNNTRPCPSPTPNGEGCTDRVTFVSSPQPTTFSVAGVDYTLAMSFVINGNPAAEFITREGLVNTASLVGQFTLPPVAPSAPVLTVTKSGPATMNVGQWGDFDIDVRNTGLTDAWDTTLRDQLPRGATGGMCDLTPEITSARVFAADGVTPVVGKGLLVPGTDYSLTYTGAPTCQLEFTTLTGAGRIGPNERLIVRYRTQLDFNTQNGVTLTNVAAAIRWFDDNSSNVNRTDYTRPLTNGTPGTVDYEDDHSVSTILTSYFFDKTVVNLTTGANPAVTAAPGDRLRYTLRFRTTAQALSNFRIFDEPDALNPLADFVPGTFALVSYPAGADISGTSATGGTKGTGIMDIRNLSLAANSVAQVQFDITLRPILANGTVITNQSSGRLSSGAVFAVSDDPNVNGTADPAIVGDEDATRLTIVSAPVFRVQKTSTDLNGDPNTLLAGERLRYSITVKNIGNADAVNVVLRDAIPANTTYVAGSTTMNGAALSDVGGMSPIVNSLAIHSPADATPGSMPADPSSSTANVATITFDIVVNSNVINATVIANQAYISAIDSQIVDVPSDDPETPIVNDPTRDIAGNLPLLYAEKRVALVVDLGSPGVVDPGDTLRYTITVQNSASINATGVVLRDAVPANTTYVANSTLLNGVAVGQPDSGVSPLAAGINISSSDRTPPLPGAGAGTISPDTTAVLQFDLRVNAGTPTGTMIRNQALVTSNELPNLLTDGDGNAATGPEATVVVVGVGQQLSISTLVTVVGGGPAIPGAQLEYTVRVVNITSIAATNVVITDNLDATQPGQLSYVNGSSSLNGTPSGISFAGSAFTANYSAINGPLGPGGVAIFRFRATVNSSLPLDTVITNTGVVTWNTPTQTASSSASVLVGSFPGFAVISGTLFHDADFDNVRDTTERPLAGWSVQLYRDDVLIRTVVTDATGAYRVVGVEPNDLTGDEYEIRFLAPGAGPNTAMLGEAVSPFTNGMQQISDVIVSTSTNVQGLNLSIHPNGVVYNSLSRSGVGGATLTLLDATTGSPLPTACFDDPAQQGQITLANGYYKFDVNFSDPACPSGGDYVIGVTVPATGFTPGLSQVIPPVSSASTAPFSVPTCQLSGSDAIPGTAGFCEIQPSELAPAPSITPGSVGTTYFLHLVMNTTPGSEASQIFNNHIPLDPTLSGTIAITKSTPLLEVTRGQLVPYTITVNNVTGELLTDVVVVDRLPAGFTYVPGSALLDGVTTEPAIAGRTLSWGGLIVLGNQPRTVKLLITIGAGVSEGEFVNHAQALNGVTSSPMSGEVTATVRIVPDPTFDCTDVTGKVFNDTNRNGRQDGNEVGLPGVRVLTPRGLGAVTDQYGRYHITCAITPNENRGSNFVLKLDDRTLPSGFRMSTEQVLVQRATRGKALNLNFGASIHRVVGIDLSDEVFEPGTTEIREQWMPRINMLLDEMRKSPAVLRLSYVADIEDKALVEKRMQSIQKQLTKTWQAAKSSYVLTIEPEVFWRRGAPVKRPDVRVPGSK